MLSRRVFLLSAFAVPGLSMLQRMTMASEREPAKVLVLSENSCEDTQVFSSYLPATQIEADPSSILQDLDNSFRQREYEFVFGLSRDSNFVVVEQYAQSSSYSLAYHGVHKYDVDGMSHSLKGNKEVLESVSTQLVKTAGHWTRAISQIPALSNYQDRQLCSRLSNTVGSCSAEGPGQLVSWLFIRKQT